MRGALNCGIDLPTSGITREVATPSLLVVQGVEAGIRFELGDQPVALGRGMQNEIRVLDTEASRLHAAIQQVRDGYVITDRNSSNGTYVNGQMIRTHRLLNGDQIQIGRTIIVFHDGREPAARSAADRINLLRMHDPADRSSIVGQLDQNADIQVEPSSEGADAAAASHFRVLYQIAEEAVRPSMSAEGLLQRILDLTISAVGADRGCILVADPITGEIQPQVLSQRLPASAGSSEQPPMPVSRTIVDYVLQMKQGVRTTDAQHDRRFDAGHSILQAGVREAMCVPMQGRNAILGTIYVDTTTPAEQVYLGGVSRFAENQLRLLIAIGRQAALAVENNRYQQAIVKAERLAAMGQTIAMLSHHIKNILQGVRGGSYLIDLGLKDENNDLVRKGWGIVEKNQNKIYHLVMDMLTFSKERQPALQPASLNQNVQDVIELMQARASDCHVELRFQPSDAIPESTFDPEGIQRAVLNIVTNAIDAVEGADQASVLVETGWSPETDSLWVSVVDNGPGIPEDQLKRIFNIFESTKGARGTGLGLAVSQKILREHGGEVSVESRLGEGSRFTLAWPRLDDDHMTGNRPTMA